MDFEKAKSFVIPRLKKELKPSLYYHNFQHTLDVCQSAENLAMLEGVNGEDRVMLKTAALYHDTGFLWQYDNNEALACDFARETLPRFDYQERHISRICELIMATQIPQLPGSHLEMIMCDADLDYIGRQDFFITALRLHREWSENSQKKIPFKDWYQNQLRFVQEHEYFTQTANKLRNERKKINLLQIRELLNLLNTSINGKSVATQTG
jgi:uncharacterized protein